MTERAFKGIWIPREIWLESHLTAVERVLWAEIDSFTGQGSSYYKTNQQAAEELGISVRNVSRVIKRLEELEGPPKGVYSVIVKWDKPIPKGNPMGLTEDTSDDYLDDLILLENEE